jgi:hypothetical protein
MLGEAGAVELERGHSGDGPTGYPSANAKQSCGEALLRSVRKTTAGALSPSPRSLHPEPGQPQADAGAPP